MSKATSLKKTPFVGRQKAFFDVEERGKFAFSHRNHHLPIILYGIEMSNREIAAPAAVKSKADAFGEIVRLSLTVK